MVSLIPHSFKKSTLVSIWLSLFLLGIPDSLANLDHNPIDRVVGHRARHHQLAERSDYLIKKNAREALGGDEAATSLTTTTTITKAATTSQTPVLSETTTSSGSVESTATSVTSDSSSTEMATSTSSGSVATTSSSSAQRSPLTSSSAQRTPLTTTTTTNATSTVTTTSASNSASSTTTTTTGGCAAKYTDGPFTISGTGTLPKPTSFVQRDGLYGLSVDGEPYKAVGPNIYWLGLDENVIPDPSYPTYARVREALAIAVAMGANTVRATSLGVSTGNNLSIEPELGVFNRGAFDAVDYAIYAANQYGLRLIIPFTDDYDYYTGGKYTFLRWTNTTTDFYGNYFYNTSVVQDAYHTYIKEYLNHINSFTGVRIGDDPTILAWETGNEFGAYIGVQGYQYVTANFTETTANVIHTYAPNHIVIDGTDGFWNYSTQYEAPGVLGAPAAQIQSDHFYPPNNPLMAKDIELIQQANKSYIIGEFDWTQSSGGTSLTDFFSSIEGNTTYISGDLAWSVFGHDNECCDYVQHEDGYSIYYPNGNDAAQQALILEVVQHWYRWTGREVPTTLPGVACPQPVF